MTKLIDILRRAIVSGGAACVAAAAVFALRVRSFVDYVRPDPGDRSERPS